MELQEIKNNIHVIRNQKVMFDFDLANLYQVETRVLKQAVRRNIERFPKDFMFELTKEEYDSLTSQNVILKGKGQHSKYLPFVLTEQLSSVLKSKTAIEVNISIMRAFVLLREYALSHKDLTEKLNRLEEKNNKQFKDISEALNYLLQKDQKQLNQKQRKPIGYK